MKRSLIVLTVLLSLFAGVAIVSANSGSAIIPHYVASTSYNKSIRQYTCYYVSNITDQNIDVEVIFYKNDGTIVSDIDNNPLEGTLRGYSVSNYKDTLSDLSLSFTIGPHSNGRFCIISSEHPDYTNLGGYGIITWKQDSKVATGLVAYGMIFSDIKDSSTNLLGQSLGTIPINNGLPF